LGGVERGKRKYFLFYTVKVTPRRKNLDKSEEGEGSTFYLELKNEMNQLCRTT
jgi:hypothetical protein